jgi:5-methyltetrahydrofolate--homocysteine methyltransferase
MMTSSSKNTVLPPFYGTRILDELTVEDVESHLDREVLFASRWQFRRGGDAKAWEELKRNKVEPIYERMMALCRREPVIVPRIVYGHFRCEKEGNGLIVHGEGRAYRFDFPRERGSPNRCLCDFFGNGFVTFQLATVGDGATRAAASKFSGHEYSDAFFLKGLASEFAEATAKYGHKYIREELLAPEGLGERFSPGDPAFPDLSAQKKIALLLAPKRIGVSLTATFQLIPEHSTSALISIDEKAHHFRPSL